VVQKKYWFKLRTGFNSLKEKKNNVINLITSLPTPPPQKKTACIVLIIELSHVMINYVTWLFNETYGHKCGHLLVFIGKECTFKSKKKLFEISGDMLLFHSVHSVCLVFNAPSWQICLTEYKMYICIPNYIYPYKPGDKLITCGNVVGRLWLHFSAVYIITGITCYLLYHVSNSTFFLFLWSPTFYIC
jgi:hypothetical protein